MVDRRKNWNPFGNQVNGEELGESLLRMFDEDNPDIGLFNSIDQEIINLGGSKMTIYKYEREDTNIDDLYGEDTFKKTYTRRYAVGHYEPSLIEENLSEFGIELQNDQFFTFNKTYIEALLGRDLLPGDIIHPTFQNFLYEVYEVQEDRFDNYGVYHVVASAKLLRDSEKRLRMLESHIGQETPPQIAAIALPTLFFNSTDVDTIKALAATTKSTEFGRLNTACANLYNLSATKLPAIDQNDNSNNGANWRQFGDQLMAMSIASIFTSNDTSAANFKAWADESASRLSAYTAFGPNATHNEGLAASHIITGLSVYLDVFYSVLTDAQRTATITALERQLVVFQRVIDSESREWVYGITSNINQTFWTAVLFAGIVLNKIGRAGSENYVSQARANYGRVFQLRNGKGEGSDPENLFYLSYSMHSLIQAVQTLVRNGYEDFTSGVWLQNIHKMYMYMYHPNFRNIVGMSDQDGVVGRGPQHTLAYLASITGEGQIEKVRQTIWADPNTNQAGNPNEGTLAMDFLQYDPSIVSAAITLPAVQNFTDWGVGVYKSNWTTSGTHLAFKSGNPAGTHAWDLWRRGSNIMKDPVISHEHADQGNFSFQPSGTRFIDGSLYERPKRTSSSNCLTFVPPSALKFRFSNAQIATVWDVSAIDQIADITELQQAGCWGNWLSEDEVGLDEDELIGGSVSGTLIPMSTSLSAVFVGGDYGSWYPSSIDLAAGGTYDTGLSSVYRTNLVVSQQVLVVVDHVDTGTQSMAPKAYFRNTWSAGDPRSITTVDAQTVTFIDETSGINHKLTAVHPAGVSQTIGRTITDIADTGGYKSVDSLPGANEDAKWATLGVYSNFVKYSWGQKTGLNRYIYLGVPYWSISYITSIVENPNWISFSVIVNGTEGYGIKIASYNTSAARLAAFGNSNTYYTITTVPIPL
jgi:hypothetical protein